MYSWWYCVFKCWKPEERLAAAHPVLHCAAQLLCLLEKLSPVLLSALEDDARMSRLFACRSVATVLKLTGKSLHPDALNKIYPGKWLIIQSNRPKACIIKSALGFSFPHRATEATRRQQRGSAQCRTRSHRTLAVQSDRRIQPRVLCYPSAVLLSAAASVSGWSRQLGAAASARWVWWRLNTQPETVK